MNQKSQFQEALQRVGMDKTIFDAVDQLVNYLYDDEQKDWEAQDKPVNHLFNDVEIVSDWCVEMIEDLQTH
jgi:hypothetical protein